MQVGEVGLNCFADTDLRLELPNASLSHVSTLKGIKRKWTTSKETTQDSSIHLGLDFNLQRKNGKYIKPKKSSKGIPGPTVDLELSLSTVPAESSVTTWGSISFQNNLGTMLSVSRVPIVDEGSASTPWKLGNAVSQWNVLLHREHNTSASNQVSSHLDPLVAVSDLSSTLVGPSKTSVNFVPEIAQLPQRSTNTKLCLLDGCGKGARGSSGHCIAHGGGRRCQKVGCHKGAEGRTAYCKAHGGGRRCQYLGCTKSSEGRTDYCIAHGGGRRCNHEGCTRAARGKSGVHGGTLFCVAHGGGKRCAMPDCTKSARGRTDFCVRHGGGKRCKFEGCVKSAQGSTDFCKAHGGGKRCSWAQLDSLFRNQAAAPCDRMARGKTGLCASHSALVQDEQVHGGGTLGPTAQDVKPSKLEKFKDVVIVEDTPVDVMKPSLPSIPEGRVHGGNLMAMLASSSGLIPHIENNKHK
ncbi:hypothetical protein AQUCO_01300211v1 [Aquilegia coerulea]|uniref:WRKY19-like zinc finger domain-containing protein n=1 Tax=Aquilegia coerulea TaxID=218851 RepID=A0A2G5E0C8_AQUCA|nr:hypothetical protein AQUCO_01300211v1 [Aquilegia coerulea]